MGNWWEADPGAGVMRLAERAIAQVRPCASGRAGAVCACVGLAPARPPGLAALCLAALGSKGGSPTQACCDRSIRLEGARPFVT